MKRLHTDNREEHVMVDLQFFLREQEIIHETRTSYIYQQNGHAEQLNHILLEKAYSM